MNTQLIAEIGINHNGSVDIAQKLIDCAYISGWQFVKLQKRTPELCVPDSQKYKLRDTPWGTMPYIEYKNKIEFGKKEYDAIYRYCGDKIKCFASVWDVPSVDFMSNYTDIVKIPSALITDTELCRYARNKFDTLIVSTGMSTEQEICQCITACRPDVIMHTNSTYPSPVDELNLSYIQWLANKWKDCEIGYSGHEYGLVTTFAAVVLGAKWIERHITADRTMWGSDQMSSVEPQGMIKLAKGIRDIEDALGKVGPRKLLKTEKIKRRSLRPD